MICTSTVADTMDAVEVVGVTMADVEVARRDNFMAEEMDARTLAGMESEVVCVL